MGSTLEEYNSFDYDYISTKVEQNVTRGFQAYTILLLFHTKIPNKLLTRIFSSHHVFLWLSRVLLLLYWENIVDL